MAKISALPALADPTGDERVPVLHDGVTHGARFADLARPALDQAAGFALAAAAMANGFPTYAAGMAGTAPGDDFSVVRLDGTYIDIFRNGTSSVDNPLISIAGENAYAGWHGSELIGFGLSSLDKATPKSLSYFGVDPFATTSQQARLEAAFTAISEEGYYGIGHPDAVYRKDGPLDLYGGARFDGQGCTFMPLSSLDQAIQIGMTGDPMPPGFELKNLRQLGARPEWMPDEMPGRTSRNIDNGITMGDIYRPVIEHFLVENVEVGSVDDYRQAGARGVPAAAFWFANVRHGRIINPRALCSLADGVHVTHGSKWLQIDHARAFRTGDDAFPVVSYGRFKEVCEAITWTSPMAYEPRSRVCAVVGGRDVTFISPYGYNPAGAGAYLASEESFDTLGVDNCHVIDGVFIGPCQGARHVGEDFRNPGTMLLGRAGVDVLSDGAIFDRTIRRSSIDATVRGEGKAMTQALDCLSEFVVQCSANIRAYDMALGNGAAIGGRDMRVRFRGHNIGGLAYYVGPGARGVHDHDIEVDGSRVAGQHPVNASAYLEATNVDEIRLTGNFRNGPAGLFATLGFDMAKLRYRDLWHNGVRVTGKDYREGQVTLQSGWQSEGNSFALVLLGDGMLSISGALSGGERAAGTLVAQLPAGYRPRITTLVPVVGSDGAAGALELRPDGGVVAVTALSATIAMQVMLRAA